MASFFFDKIMCACRLPRGQRMNPHRVVRFSVAREIIGPKSLRRTENLVVVNENPASTASSKLVVVRRHDCSVPRRQTHNQSPIGGDTYDASAHRATTAP